MSGTKPAVTLAVCGHVDSGKSTVIGHLLYLLGVYSEEEMAKAKTIAEENGKSSFGYAYLLDHDKEERERGNTIQCNSAHLVTSKVSALYFIFVHPHCPRLLLIQIHLQPCHLTTPIYNKP